MRTHTKKMTAVFAALTIAWAWPVFAGDYEFEKKIAVDGTPDVSVTLLSGDVVVRAAEGKTVIVKATRDLGRGIELDGARIRISTRTEEFGEAADCDVRLELPPASRLAVTTVNGDVDVHGLSGKIEVRAVNGKLDARDIGGPFSFKAINGGVLLENIASGVSGKVVNGDLSGKSISGDLAELAVVRGDMQIEGLGTGQVRVKSVSGDITVKGALAPKAVVKIGTVSGDAEFQLPGDSAFEADLRSKSGELSTDFATSERDKVDNRIHIEVGEDGADIEMSSLSGDLKISKQD